jgi:hypothetical protein
MKIHFIFTGNVYQWREVALPRMFANNLLVGSDVDAFNLVRRDEMPR